MTVSLLHTTPADGTFSAQGATAWDAEHALTMAGSGKVLGRTTAGTGAVEELTEITLTSGTKTASAPVMDMTQTWNNAAVTFTGYKFNITDTASGASSLLMDLQVGGSTKVKITKTGGIIGYEEIRAGSTYSADSGFLDVFNNNTNAVAGTASGSRMRFAHNVGLFVASNLLLGFSSTTTTINQTPDAMITRRAAANLRFGAADAAAPVAQTLSVQSVVAGTSNTAGANLTITGSQGTGTGAAGHILFQTASAGTTGTAQNALATVLTIGPNTLSGSQAISLLDMAQTWNTSGTPTAIKLNVTDTASATASLLMDLQVGGSSVAHFTKNGILRVGNASKSGVIHNQNDVSLRAGTGGDGYGNNILTVTSSNLVQMPFGNLSFGGDITLTRRGAANLRLGAADAAAPVAQTLSVQSVVAGTSNTAGKNWTLTGSVGTGTGAGGDVIVQVAPAGTTGTAQNSLQEAFRVHNTRTVTAGAAFTVATLPAAGTQGRRAWVTDATAPTFLGTLTGGGAVVCPVFDDGTNWVAA